MIDPVLFGQQMAAIVREATAPLIKRIEELESREPARGEDGKSITPEDVAPMIAAEVAKAMAALPAPKDGESVTVEDVAPLIAEQVKAAVEAIPKPKDGKDGRDGKDGEKGADGKDGVDGKDGIGLAGATIDRNGELIVTLTNGEQKALGPVVGRDGKDGADFSDVEIGYDGERTITIKGRGGDITKRVPLPLDRGFWREGMACEKADIVTQDGAAWIALRDTKAKPCLENKDDWRLFARKGRDGKDGRNGIDKTATAKVGGYQPDVPMPAGAIPPRAK